MHPLLQSLAGGDRRSIGASNRAVETVQHEPALIDVLFRGMAGDDPLLRMRCADVAEKVTARRPDLLVPYKETLLRRLSLVEQQEVRWHVAPMLARLPLSDAEAASVMRMLLSYTNDRSSIVKTMAMQALADVALRHPELLAEARQHVEELTVIGTPAMKARGRKLLPKLRIERIGK